LPVLYTTKGFQRSKSENAFTRITVVYRQKPPKGIIHPVLSVLALTMYIIYII